jgi:hypothetical protein
MCHLCNLAAGDESYCECGNAHAACIKKARLSGETPSSVMDRTNAIWSCQKCKKEYKMGKEPTITWKCESMVIRALFSANLILLLLIVVLSYSMAFIYLNGGGWGGFVLGPFLLFMWLWLVSEFKHSVCSMLRDGTGCLEYRFALRIVLVEEYPV